MESPMVSPKGSVGAAGLLGGQGAVKHCWLGTDELWGPVQCGTVGPTHRSAL